MVFHFAARAGVRPSIADPRLYVSTNIDGTLNLLEGCRKTGVKHFVFASSSSVYGVNEKVPVRRRRSDPAHDLPLRRHQAGRRTALFQLLPPPRHALHLPALLHRLWTAPAAGPRHFQVHPQDHGGRTDRAIRRRQHRARLHLCRGHHQRRDGRRPLRRASDFEIINLGGSAANTLSQLIAGIEEILGKKATIHYLPDQPGDVPLTFADVSKARRLLGYTPATPLRPGPRTLHRLGQNPPQPDFLNAWGCLETPTASSPRRSNFAIHFQRIAKRILTTDLVCSPPS